ncbi:MAG: hypothetical protein HY898_31450 [Deltaproteobacteria bacterium]|nr:hypothetical protein [Deltaproteobacteria bacterium]
MIRQVRCAWVSLVVLAACGGSVVVGEPQDGGAAGSASGAGGASAKGGAGGTSAKGGAGGTSGTGGAGGVSGTAGSAGNGLFGVCHDYVAMVNHASSDPCTNCLASMSTGQCKSSFDQLQTSSGACGGANDCAMNNCSCKNGPPCDPDLLCGCVDKCMLGFPDSCAATWKNALSCAVGQCSSACQ